MMAFGDHAMLTDRMLSDRMLSDRQQTKAGNEAPKPGIEEWWIKSHPDYQGKRTDWEFACSEIR